METTNISMGMGQHNWNGKPIRQMIKKVEQTHNIILNHPKMAGVKKKAKFECRKNKRTRTKLIKEYDDWFKGRYGI